MKVRIRKDVMENNHPKQLVALLACVYLMGLSFDTVENKPWQRLSPEIKALFEEDK